MIIQSLACTFIFLRLLFHNPEFLLHTCAEACSTCVGGTCRQQIRIERRQALAHLARTSEKTMPGSNAVNMHLVQTVVAGTAWQQAGEASVEQSRKLCQ